MKEAVVVVGRKADGWVEAGHVDGWIGAYVSALHLEEF